MSQNDNLDLLLPPGRMVWGDLYTGRTENQEGRPLTYKNGQPRSSFEFGVAIPKGAEQHWAESEWGKAIWNYGHSKWPAGQGQRPDFAWKVRDGDSTIPTATGRIPRDNPGYAGHWIVSLSSSIAPRLYKLDSRNSPVPFPEPDAIKPGDWIEAYANIASNENLQKPGIYINHSMVCFRGRDPDGRFSLGPNVSAAGFGGARVPTGVSVIPTTSALATQSPPPPATQSPLPPPTVATAQPPAYTPPGLAATQGIPSPPGVVDAPLPPVGPVMLPAAKGIPYEAYIAAGWNDDTLRQAGLMQ